MGYIRLMRFTRIVALGILVTSVALSACGGDDTSSGADPVSTDVSGDQSTSDTVNPDDLAAAGDMLGLSAKCTQIYTSMFNALGSIGSTDESAKETFATLGDEFAAIKDQVPADLKDDVEVLARDYAKYGQLIDKYADDPNALSNPDVLQEFNDVMSSEEFNSASNNFTDWLDNECALSS